MEPPEPALLGSLASKGDGTSSNCLYGSCTHQNNCCHVMRSVITMPSKGMTSFVPGRPALWWLTEVTSMSRMSRNMM